MNYEMNPSKARLKPFSCAAVALLALVARPDVRVFVQETNGQANINYQCTAGETVRAFALDVTVDRGQILAVTNYFRGPSTVAAQGYGIFPASFRDNINVSSGTNANWGTNVYSPLAVVADNPAGTLPGLNSSGVTLEFGTLWDPTVPAAAPRSSGTLCSLQISQTASITIAPNVARGGILGSPLDLALTTRFTGALIGPAILSANLVNGSIRVTFQDGELESSPSLNGPWTGTGNTSGVYTEVIGATPGMFYRVHQH
jgi:hypothetical protein